MRFFCLLIFFLVAAGCHGAEDGIAAKSGGASPPAKKLFAAFAKAAWPALDPSSPFWEKARETVIALLPQDVTEPRLLEKGAESLRLCALHNGAEIAFRLEWADVSPDGITSASGRSDACAIELPATGGNGPLPDSMMGEKGKPVHIVYWRFASQERLEGKPHGVAALYPNAWIDHYPFEAARDEAARAEMETRYAPARAAKNPVATERDRRAVEDLLAEGFGTLAPAPEQTSSGRGVHEGGRWRVVISRPLDFAANARTQLRPGTNGFVAVAVWDGSKGHAGGKKMRSIWVPMEIEGEKP
jgi:hypothetical protein